MSDPKTENKVVSAAVEFFWYELEQFCCEFPSISLGAPFEWASVAN